MNTGEGELIHTFVAVLTDTQLLQMQNIVSLQVNARGLGTSSSSSSSSSGAGGSEGIHTVMVTNGNDQEKTKTVWQKAPSTVKEAPKEDETKKVVVPIGQREAGPFWDEEANAYVYRCCKSGKCQGRVFPSYQDGDDSKSQEFDSQEEYDDEDDEEENDNKPPKWTISDVYKKVNNTGLFIHGLEPSNNYETGRKEILSVLKGVQPKNTRVEPNESYGFVYFDSHSKAVEAQKLFMEEGYKANFLRKK